jgi:hypothetical protein
MKAKSKPAMIGCINAAFSAKLQVIDEKAEKWKTLAECMDTPNSVQEAVSKLTEAGIDVRRLWIKTPDGRRMISWKGRWNDNWR